MLENMFRSLSRYILWGLLVSAEIMAATWPIELDGKKVDATWYPLSDNPDVISPGDVIHVGDGIGGLWLCVRDIASLSFVNRLPSEGILYRRISDRLEVVGFDSSAYQKPRQRGESQGESRRPSLTDLSADTLRSLWGVALQREELPEVHALGLRVESTFCSIEYPDYGKTPPPRLPERLKYVSLSWSAPLSDVIYNVFSSDLVYLELRVQAPVRGQIEKLDSARLRGATNLRALVFSAANLEPLETIAELKELRYLNLNATKDLTSTSWLAGLPRLVELGLSRTRVSDVAPLATLAALRKLHLASTAVRDLEAIAALPELEHLSIQALQVSTLPRGGFKSLKSLRAIRSTLPTAEIERFRRDHPHCQVLFEWRRALVDALRGADRMALRLGGLCHRNPAQEKLLFETHERSAIDAFLASLEIDEGNSNSFCMCCGSPTVEFYREQKLLAELGVQHGEALRWDEWPTDAKLTENSARALVGWLTQRGITDIKLGR